MSKAAIHYSIVPKDLAGHLFQIILTVAKPDPLGQQMTLPAWIPGSYMVREFARNIVRLRAHSNGKKVAIKKLEDELGVIIFERGGIMMTKVESVDVLINRATNVKTTEIVLEHSVVTNEDGNIDRYKFEMRLGKDELAAFIDELNTALIEMQASA